jgi:hypothetical protein
MVDDRVSLSKDHSLRLLNKFLVDNPQLEELSAKLSVFNILNVLRIEKTEIRHSNVLAWLMDPQGSHGMGQAFIRRVLSTMLLESDSVEIALNPANVELMNMIDVEVLREWQNIDLLAFSETNSWVLLIENKIKSRASRRQLLKYIKLVEKEFKNFTIIPVLLTLEPDDGLEAAEDTGYITWSHAQLYHVANQVIYQRKDRIPEDAKVFIQHYLNVLRRLTMQDKEIVQLCKNIYRKHKDAIDLIVEWGATTQFGAAAEEFILINEDLEQLCLAPSQLWFVHKNWTKTMPACSDRWKHLSKPYPVACWFRFRPPKIGFLIEVGSIEDSKMRLKLINAFKEKGFKIGIKAYRPEAKYTRVHSIYRKIQNADDQEELQKLLEELWKKSSKAFNLTTNIINSFKW